jgi:poly(3-hydroxybutyrate) depolymerase
MSKIGRARRSLVVGGFALALALALAACGSGNPGGGGAGTSGGHSAPGGASGTAGAASGTAGSSGTNGNGGATTGRGGGNEPVAGTTGNGGSVAGVGGSAGQIAGASGTGGQVSGSGGTGGRAGGNAGSAGQAGSGGHVAGSGGAGGSSGAAGTGGGAAQSAGCGRTRTLQNGTISITFSNASRKYILRVPDGYDNNHPYRLVLAYAWSGASASQVVSANYFTFATLDSKNTVFAAPDAADGAGSWSNGDVALTDAILAQIEGDLCIDKTRVFATGFSFGGGMAMALACTRADVFRAVAFFSGADLTNSCPATLTKPIAYYASQASEDSGGLSTTSPITGERKQAQFAEVNGCTPEPSSTTFPAAGQPHVCTNYKNCSVGHPTEYCVFNGPHGWEPKDPGQTMSWNAPEAWKFITQF